LGDKNHKNKNKTSLLDWSHTQGTYQEKVKITSFWHQESQNNDFVTKFDYILILKIKLFWFFIDFYMFLR